MIIKICGISRQEDLDFMADAGIDYCGFIFHPSSPRYVSPKLASALESGRMTRVGVFVNQGYDEIARVRDEAKLDIIQLHGDQSRQVAARLGAESVARVLWPQRRASDELFAEELDSWAEYCAFFLLDAGKSLGGSGATLDWASLRKKRFPRPWFLAGGLNPANIKDALNLCSPFGADLNSGVESAPGVKDHKKIGEIIKIIRSR